MTNRTSRIRTDGDDAYMNCPHHDECHRVVHWRLGQGAKSRALEMRAYGWFERQLRNHTH